MSKQRDAANKAWHLQALKEVDRLRAQTARFREALQWDADLLLEILQTCEPAGQGWFKVRPGTLTTIGELEVLTRTALAEEEA